MSELRGRADEKITRSQYLTRRLMILNMGKDTPLSMIREAVATTVMSHPEWDLEKRQTYAEWKAEAETT